MRGLRAALFALVCLVITCVAIAMIAGAAGGGL